MGGVVMCKWKYRQKKSYIIETNCKHSKRGYGKLPLGDVYTCHGFLQKTCKFEENDSKTFFHKLTQWFVDIGFSNLWEPIINIILETLNMTLCNYR
jgi:hypothetical protein